MNISALTKFGSRAYLKLRKISPELALGAGIVCGLGAVVAGCIASRNVDKVLNDTRNELDEIQTNADVDPTVNCKKESFNAYKKCAWELTKLYAPTLGLTMASVGFTMASHGILSKRYIGLSTTYSALDAAFKDYRRRVKGAIGEDAERILAGGGKVEKNIRVSNDDGSVELLKNNNLVITDHKESPYEFDFNRYTAKGVWEPNADLIYGRLNATQKYLNTILNSRGHLFLNEALDELGLERTQAGAICGWFLGAGDDCVDLGCWDSFKIDYDQDSDLCVKNVHLNFNCDGVIFDML